VLARLADLLRALRRGYRIEEETLRRPRGKIVWTKYVRESLTRGKWDQLPCRFPDLANDPKLRRMIRWGVERVRQALMSVSNADAIARLLVSVADEVLTQLRDVVPLVPPRDELTRLADNPITDVLLRNGLEALGWVADERGLGGGREMDGLAWSMQLHELWERYVEATVRREVASIGGQVRVGRKRETVFPLEWTDPSHRSMGQLIPDIVVFRGDSVHIVDAKYKAHLAELDEHGWYRFTTDAREAHRADIHQALAYASLYAAAEVKATLVYPLRQSTYESLRSRDRDVSVAQLLHGARQVRLELRGMPFG
jgi:5-methylcytosine-specific restriction endonuclease McrBC regulatory subunit McrC